MEVQVAQLTPVLVEFSVTVDADLVKKEHDKAFADLQKRARVPGFRPGKAPREVLAYRFGGAVTSDVCSKLANETLDKALTEKNVQPLSQPKIEVEVASNTALKYKARFEVRPEIAELKWEGLAANKTKVAVDGKDVESAIQALRKQHSQLTAPEAARAAKAGDVVTIDFVAHVDGKQIDKGDGVTAELGEGKLVKELEDALVGSSIGDAKDVVVTFPGDHQSPTLRGKAATFKIKLVDVKERKLPELDDEFAKDVGEFTDLAALRADVEGRLKKQREDEVEQQLVTQLVAALCNANQVVAPPSLVQQQLQLTLSELQQSARRQGQKLQVTQELQRQLEVDSDVKVRAGLLMAEIAKRNNLTVDDKDLEKGMEDIAKETGKNIARVRAEYRDQTRRQMLIGMILEDKVLDLIIAKANITEVDAPAGT